MLFITRAYRPIPDGVNVDNNIEDKDEYSESLMSHSDISDDDVNEGVESPIPVWQDDDDEEAGVVGGSDVTPNAAIDHIARCNHPLPTTVHVPALEITFSTSYEDGQLSPSSVSYNGTAVFPDAMMPALPLAHHGPLESATFIPSYRLACQRRVEELKRRASDDFAIDQDLLSHMSHSQRENQQIQRTSSSSLQPTGPRWSASTLPVHHDSQQPQQRQWSIRSRNNTGISFQGRVPSPPRSCTTTPRFLLISCAFFLLILSVHDRVESSSERFIIDARIVEEVAFPLHPQPVTKQQRIELPKYYLPTTTSTLTSAGVVSTTTDEAATGGSRAVPRALKQQAPPRRPNLAMARTTHQTRPVFVPDVDATSSVHGIKRERFYFDPNQQQKEPPNYSRSNYSSAMPLSWTSWLVGGVLVGMLVETGWREHQKCRIRDEQRRL